MKRIVFLLPILLISLLISCTQNNIESKAKEQMKKTIKELAKNPDTYKISNIKTMFIDDSLVVLNFIGKGQNGFGGYSTSKYEYIYAIKNDGVKESLYDLEDRGSIIGKKAFSEIMGEILGDTLDTESSGRIDTAAIKLAASLTVAFNGRYIEE